MPPPAVGDVLRTHGLRRQVAGSPDRGDMTTETLRGPSTQADLGPTPPGDPTAPLAIEITGLTISYGSHSVLTGLDLRVEHGEIFGILGHNGAGKTTLVEALQGLRHVDHGAIRVLGLDPTRHTTRLRRRIGSQLQSSALPDRLRVGEAVRLFARLAGDVVDWRHILTSWDLARLAGTPFRSLSGGERQRVFLALALVGRPEVVILDELTQGLDPVARRETWSLIERVRDEGATIVLVSHHMDEVQALCDRVGLLAGGRFEAVGTPGELVVSLGGGARISFSVVDRATPGLAAALRAVHGIEDVRMQTARGRTTFTLHGRDGSGVTTAALLHQLGHRPTDFRVQPPDLEDVIVDLAARSEQTTPESRGLPRTKDRSA